MKKYSDYFSCLKRSINNVGNRIATTALFMVAAITMAFAQVQEPFKFIEGSEHHFSVTANSENKFAWGMYIDPYATESMDPGSFELSDNGTSPDLTIKFNDIQRDQPELVYLVVEETNPSGCSTKRALQIQLEPNNMYLEFAEKETKDCYNLDNYLAPLKIGLNFTNKAAGDSIPAQFFPLSLTYTVLNKEGTDTIKGNGGIPVTIAFSPTNDYSLLIPEAVGLPNQTVMYELAITSVTDRYKTVISDNLGDRRIQIRVINHLPQSGNMDMALAYYIVNP